MNQLLNILAGIGRIVLLAFFVIFIIAIVRLLRPQPIDYLTIHEVKTSNGDSYLIDYLMFCSPIIGDNKCYIAHNEGDSATKKGPRCGNCGKFHYEHFRLNHRYTEKEWERHCEDIDRTSYLNYHSIPNPLID